MRGIDEIVDRQVRRWEVSHRAALPRQKRLCVALSRLPHSGGAELGQRVADKLDYGFFGIEIVEQIAQEHGVQRRLVEGVDEHVRSLIDRHLTDVFRSRPFTESDYLRHLVRTVTTLGKRGMSVILGRGSPFILSAEEALRVFVVASTATRVERLAKKHDLGSEEAADRLGWEDAQRRDFLHHHFRVDPDDPRHYDLVVNTGTLGIDAAAAVVVDVLGHCSRQWDVRRALGSTMVRTGKNPPQAARD